MDIRQLKEDQKKNNPDKARDVSFLDQLSEFWQKDISLQTKFSIKDKERFFTETGMLLAAGVDLQTSLELSIEGANNNKKLQKIYSQINTLVTSGSSLADAMDHTHKFNNFDKYSIAIGENTGELHSVFKQLQQYYTKRIAQQRKIAGAMSYPIIILLTTIGAVMFMLKFVVPMFAQTLLQFGGELPAITRFIIALSDSFSEYFFVVLIICAIIGAYLYANRNNDVIRKHTANILLNIPVWGKLMKKVHLAQFTASMSLLLAARVNIYESIELTEKMTRFYPIQHALKKAKEGLSSGNSFYDSVKVEPIFDHKITALIKIGEEINQLDVIFEQLSIQMQQEIDYQSNVLITVLEPLMILFLAVVIGIILIAMYLPMFKLGSAIN